MYSPILALSPEMGSGRLPEDAFGVNLGRTAYVAQIQVVTSPTESAKFEDPEMGDIKVWTDKAVCYNATIFVNDIQGSGYSLYYGGPGNCTYPPSGVGN